VTNCPGASFTRDPDGNLPTDGISTYSIDGENRLAVMVKSGIAQRLESACDGRCSDWIRQWMPLAVWTRM
jgi:hypothetical protein